MDLVVLLAVLVLQTSGHSFKVFTRAIRRSGSMFEVDE